MELKEIQDLIKFVAKSGVSEVELETKEIKIIIKTGHPADNTKVQEPLIMQSPLPLATSVTSLPPVQSGVQTPNTEVTTPAKKTPSAEEEKYITIKSPMIGTFYRSSSPDKPAFINIGDEIKPGKVMCIIEAMKLFNEIESEVSGKIVKVLVNDASPVEYDQPLFLVDPS